MKAAAYAVSAVLLLALAAAGWWAWQQAYAPRPVDAAPPVLPVVNKPAAAASGATAAAGLHPITSVPVADAASGASAAASTDIDAVIGTLFGRPALLSMFDLRDFPQRFVATVDNLGRSHAASRLWPVVPAPAKFLHMGQGGSTVINPDNGLRYTPHVLLFEAVDLQQLVAAYVRLYPQFQQAYEELGYPRRHFNDRLVEVIDLLLQTPQVSGPIRVHLPTINSPVPLKRPWVIYEFDDPALQSLASGQKILLRMGPVNARRVKARLQALRQLLASGSPAR